MSHRIQFDFSDEAFERFNQIRDMSGAQSNAEVVRDALSIYKWVILQMKDNNVIKVIFPDGKEKIVKFFR